MKKLLVIAAVLGLLVLAFFLGPRVRFEPSGPVPEMPTAPTALVAALAGAESAVGDLVPGAEKAILWANPGSPGRTEYALVYLHGFSASRRETEPFSRLVATALGANLFYARLAGHGHEDLDAMGQVDAADWYADALEALGVAEAIGDKTVLVGTSTGATLATVLAEQHPERIHALVFISPNFAPANRAAWLTAGPWGEQIGRLVMGAYRGFEPQNEQHERYWTTRYPSRAIPVMMSLVSYAADVEHERLPVPLILFASPGDQVVDFDVTSRIFEDWGAGVDVRVDKELVLVEDSDDPGSHVLAGDILSPSTTGRLAVRTVAFIAGLPDP